MIPDTTDIHDNLRGQGIDERTGEMGNHAPRLTTRGANVQRSSRFLCFRWLWLVLLFAVAPLFAAGEWVLLPEPKFMGHKITQPIPEAKSTVLAVARLGEFGPEFPSKEAWENATVSAAALAASTRTVAAAWLKELKPELTRGPDKVVEYARLTSEKIPVAAVILAPEFVRQFEDIFGPKPLVVMPNRHTVFVFPALAGKPEKLLQVVMTAWRSDAPKVSLEVFEVTEKGLRAVATFEE